MSKNIQSCHPCVNYEVYRNDKHRRTMQLNKGLFKFFCDEEMIRDNALSPSKQ